MKNEITKSDLFGKLDDKNQKKILDKIKTKDYKIIFNTFEVTSLSWADISRKILRKNEVLNEIYTLFSLYAHPSYVSIMQYREMFTKEKPNEALASSFLRICLTLCSIFLVDYIKVFPWAKETFERNSLANKFLMNMYNISVRG